MCIYTYIHTYVYIEKYRDTLDPSQQNSESSIIYYVSVSVTLVSSFLPRQDQPGQNLQSHDASHLEKEKEEHANNFRK